MDGLGFLFLTIWLLCLQVFFDKGNNADWFNATWIRWIFGVSCFPVFASSYLKLSEKIPLLIYPYLKIETLL